MENAISALNVHISPKFPRFSEIGVGEHDGYVRFLTGIRNIGVLRMRYEADTMYHRTYFLL